ncbi:MAG: hypothetical protein RLZZ336_1343 [Cyanobacteriota bacterium]
MDQQLRHLRTQLSEQGHDLSDRELGLRLLNLRGLDEALSGFPQDDRDALGRFLVKLAESPALATSLVQLQTADQAAALAAEAGCPVSPAILVAMHEAPQDLNDEDLAQVTGGIIGAITVGVGIAAAVVGVLAVANDVEAFLYSDSSSFLGDGIRNTGKTVLGWVP